MVLGEIFYLVVASNFQPVQVFKQVSSNMQKKVSKPNKNAFKTIVEFHLPISGKKSWRIWISLGDTSELFGVLFLFASQLKILPTPKSMDFVLCLFPTVSVSKLGTYFS